MIILLTGKPGIGKSTVIEKFIRLNTLPSTWVVTTAILQPETGLRLGFQANNSDGEEQIISHKKTIQSDKVIGENRVDVDIEAVDAMFANALDQAIQSNEKLVIIDEIGPIQLLSEEFSDSLKHAFSTHADIVASIHYSDERLSEYRTSPNNLLLEVTEDNRNMLPDALVAITKNLTAIHLLSEEQRKAFDNLFIVYIRHASLLQIQKLTSNAVYYVTKGKVKKINDSQWRVEGKHDLHDVSQNQGTFCPVPQTLDHSN